jgi:hypothetical protein
MDVNPLPLQDLLLIVAIVVLAVSFWRWTLALILVGLIALLIIGAASLVRDLAYASQLAQPSRVAATAPASTLRSPNWNILQISRDRS